MKPLIAIGALSTFALATAAFAQAPAPAAAPVAAAGPTIPGVCVFWSQKMLAVSSSGKLLGERMTQLKASAQAELQTDQNALAAEQNRIKALPKDQQEQQAPAFEQKYLALQSKAQHLNAELQVTERLEGEVIDKAVTPILNQVFAERGCSILFERGSLLAANPSMDLTDTVVQRLNGTLPTLPAFERAHLDAQGNLIGGQGASAAAPATRTTAAPAPATTTHKKK